MSRNRHRPPDPRPQKGQSAAGGNSPPGKEREYRSIVHAIQSLTKEVGADGKKNDTYRNKSLFWNKATAGLVAVYTLFTAGLLVLGKCSVDATRESFAAVQRAFIVVSGLKEETVRDDAGKVTGYRFSPIIRNSGNTPAKAVEWITINPFSAIWLPQYRQFSRAPAPIDPDEIFHHPEHMIEINHTILGPRDDIPTLPEFAIDAKRFQDILGGRIGRFYFGVIHYRDTFSDEGRVTMYCYTLNNLVDDKDGLELSGPIVTGAIKARPFVNLCSHWNCADNECAKDRQSYDDEISKARQNAPAKQ